MNTEKTISNASDKNTSIASDARLIITHFNLFVTQNESGIPFLPIEDREPAFRDKHFAAIDSIIDLIFILEDFEIINPNLEIFRTALSYASHCMNETFRPFQQVLLEFLPYDVPVQDKTKLGTDAIIPKIPSKDDLKNITDVAQPYIDAATDAGCYILDLSKEAQNIFIGNLFSHRVPSRKPIDPKHVVISTAPNDVVKLKKYFLEETEWGKNNKKVADEIKKSLARDPQRLAQQRTC